VPRMPHPWPTPSGPPVDPRLSASGEGQEQGKEKSG
jgi:hypothetical protein